MANDDFDNDHEDPDDVETPDPAADGPKALRRAADEGKKAKADNLALKREVAMLKAGVDTESPVGQLFAKGYDGDISPDAVKAAWAALGVITPAATETPATPDPDITDDETTSTAQRSALAANAPADQAPTPDPREKALEAGRAAVKGGGTTEDSLAATFHHLVGAAIDGDTRVIVNTRA